MSLSEPNAAQEQVRYEIVRCPLAHPDMNHDRRKRTYTLPSDRRRTSQSQDKAVLTKAAMSFIFSQMDHCANNPIAEMAGGPTNGLRWENNPKSPIKPKRVKAIAMREITQSGRKQSHGEYLLIFQSLGTPWMSPISGEYEWIGGRRNPI